MVVHCGQEVRGGGRIRLCGGHLGHKLGGVDRLVLLRLRVEQLRVQRIAEELGLIKVAASKEVVEVGIAAVCQVERVWGNVGALGPKVRRVVLREALGSVQKGLVG